MSAAESDVFTGAEALARGQEAYEAFMREQLAIAHQSAREVIESGGITQDTELFLSTFLPYFPFKTRGNNQPSRYTAREDLAARIEKLRGSRGLVGAIIGMDATFPRLSGVITPMPERTIKLGDSYDVFPAGEHMALEVVTDTGHASEGTAVGASSLAHVLLRNPDEKKFSEGIFIFNNGVRPFGSYDPRGQDQLLIGMGEINASNLEVRYKERFAEWTEGQVLAFRDQPS